MTTTITRCPVTSGHHRCDKPEGHDGEHETRDESARPSVRPRVVVPVIGLRCPTCDQAVPEKTP